MVCQFMAGHNKWSKVKHIKAKTDAQKGNVFSKIVREIIVAVKSGGGDPDMNPSLRLVLQKARQSNMPKDNILRAIEKGLGGGDGTQLEEITYEAYGPQGVAILIQALTDNKNRTIPNIRTIVTKAGGSMASKGAVSYLFEKKGVIVFDAEELADQIVEVSTEHGAEDIDLQDDGTIIVTTSVDTFDALCQQFEKKRLLSVSTDLQMVPSTTISLDGPDAGKILTMIQQLEEDDDVQNVFANYDISNDVMASFFAEQ